MRKALRWIATSLVAFCALGVLAIQFWFHAAQRAIAARVVAPQLALTHTPAAPLSFYTLAGQPKHLSDYTGKVVFLDLWGTWCVQCVAEMPTIQKLYNRYRGNPDVAFLLVSRMDSAETIRTYARRGGYSLPFYRMNDADIPGEMRLGQFPSTFLIDRKGTIVVQHTGAADWDAQSVQQLIRSLEAQS